MLNWLEQVCPERSAKWEGATQVASIIERAGYFTYEYLGDNFDSAANRVAVAANSLNRDFDQSKLRVALKIVSRGIRDTVLPIYFMNEG